MALIHHDNRQYEAAASDAAIYARGKLTAEIERGQASAQSAIERIFTEVPTDLIIPAERMKFVRGAPVGPNEYRHPVQLDVKERIEGPGIVGFDIPLSLHNHALVQVGQRGGIAKRYVDMLSNNTADWSHDLLVHNLNELYQNMPKNKRFLVRSLGTEARGFLSDSYRRLDSRPIIEAFVNHCQAAGAVPVKGHYMGTKISVKALMPVVYEPVPNEVMAYGVQISNSDYGDGALTVQSFVMRLWCTNYAIATDALRQVHLGSKLGDNIKFSQTTYDLDTKTTVSAVNDIMKGLLSQGSINKLLDGVRAANEEKVSPMQVKAFLKKHLSAADATAVTEKFASADIELLPAGQTKWRMSNALSWFAGTQDQERKRLDLEELAGKAASLVA